MTSKICGDRMIKLITLEKHLLKAVHKSIHNDDKCLDCTECENITKEVIENLKIMEKENET
jgi:hypothetical protein